MDTTKSSETVTLQLIGDIYSKFMDEMGQTVARWSSVICETAITCDFDFTAGLEKGSCGRYAIFMDAIVFLQLQVCFRRLLSHPEVLPGIGAPPKGYQKPKFILLKRSVQHLGSGVADSPASFDRTRELASHFLTYRAVIFLWMHEVGHIVEERLDKRSSAPASSQLRRGFEHLADMFAIRNCLLSEISLRRDDPLDPYRYRLWGFAIYVFWQVLDQHSSELDKSDNHPQASVRALLFEAFVNTHFRDVAGISEVVKGIDEASKAWDIVDWPRTSEPHIDQYESALEDLQAARSAARE